MVTLMLKRGFSVSNNILTAERTDMTLQTLNGLLVTKDALLFNDPVDKLPGKFPLTRSLLQSYKTA